MSKGSSGRPSRCSISAATLGTSGELRMRSSMLAHARFGELAAFIEGARNLGGRRRRIGIDAFERAKVAQHHRVARVGLGRRR